MSLTAVVRRPAVAGYFYPADPGALRAALERLTRGGAAQPAHAVIIPHGSLQHAGAVIGATVAGTVIPRRVIIVGPSHTGVAPPWSVLPAGAYRTPLGDVPVDEPLAEALAQRCPFLEPDPWTQHGEHAVEMLLPFLQYAGPADLSLVPIVHGSDRPEELAQLGQALAEVVRQQPEPVLLMASSDLSHYAPHARIQALDRLLLDAVEQLDGPGLQRTVASERITMCGVGSVGAVMDAAVRLGARSARTLAYGTSAGGGGDPLSTVGYAGVHIL